jgi:hypothetical protein
MARRLDPPWRKWFLLYVGTAVLGLFAVFGGLLPPQWFEGWLWWQRLLLVVLGSPFVIAAYLACEAIVEALLRVAANATSDRPLPVVVGLLALASLLYAFVHLFPF